MNPTFEQRKPSHFISDENDRYVPSSSGVLLGPVMVGEVFDGSGSIVVVTLDVVVVDVVVFLAIARAVAVVATDGDVAAVVMVSGGSFTTCVCLAVTKRVVVSSVTFKYIRVFPK